MKASKNYITYTNKTVSEALKQLNKLGDDLTLFVVDEKSQKLVGTITDGDIRRGLIKGLQISEKVTSFMNRKFRSIKINDYTLEEIDAIKKIGITIIPLVDDNGNFLRLINLKDQRSVLPIDVLIMAGGEGLRLRPLTEKVPKPMLKVGEKPIIEHTVDRLANFGISHINISVKYLGDKIKSHLGDGNHKNVNINYVTEKEALGTIGSLSLVKEIHNDIILVMNSDILTNIDFEEFYREFIKKKADMAVATIPYNVNIPYAILETDEHHVLSLKEKPTITYYSNAGIYLIRKEMIKMIPHNSFYNATDLIELLIHKKKKVTYDPILGYWLDIGKMDDFYKAQEDIKHLKF
jgi:dTDP-glucose pyrophosphorylase